MPVSKPTTQEERDTWASFYMYNPDNIPAPTIERILRLIADLNHAEKRETYDDN